MLESINYIHFFDIPLIGLLYVFLEYHFPLNFSANSFKRPEAFQDIIWLYFNELVQPQLTVLLNMIFAYIFWSRLSLYFSFQKIHLSPLLTLAAVFFWRDFIFWLNHLLAHRLSFLWRFHELHHSSNRLDWLAGFRGYWLDSFIFETFMGLIFFFVDISPHFMLLWGYFELNSTYFIHTNTNFRMGIFKNWINNPYTHHWHHASESKFSGGQNFGAYTMIWDRLFGTFYAPSEFRLPSKYGLAENTKYPEGLLRRFFHPFLKRD